MDEPNLTGVALSVTDLIRRRETLTRRLEDGLLRIDQAELDGRDVTDWESFWIGLLREYEQICDLLNDITDEPLAA